MSERFRNRVAKVGLALMAVLAIVVALASAAQAKSVHPYLGSINGSKTPAEEFAYPTGVAVDPNGYVYVASWETNSIDIFNPAHELVTSIHDPEKPAFGAAVDSKGNVYVVNENAAGTGGAGVALFSPDSFPPSSATNYTQSIVMKSSENHSGSGPNGVAVNPKSDHLLVVESGGSIAEYKSAEEGSGLLSSSIGQSFNKPGALSIPYVSMAVDGESGDIFLLARKYTDFPQPVVLSVLNPDGTSILHEITGAGSPAGELFTGQYSAQLAIDQSTGNVYITQFGPKNGTGEIYEFEEDGTFVSAIGPTFGGSLFLQESEPSGLAVDNSSTANKGNVYVGSGTSNAVVYEFGPLTNLFELSVSKAGSTGSGNVSSSPAGIDCGSTCSAELEEGDVTLTESAGVGSEFAGWSGCDSEEEGGKKCIVTLDEAKAVTATFNEAVAPNEFPLSVSKAGTGSGTVTSSPAGINCGSTCSAEFEEGEVVSLSTTPASGSTFAGWSGACTGTGACEVTITEAASVTATFNLQSSGEGGKTNPPPPPTPTCATNASLCPPSTATAASKAQVKSGKAALQISCPGPGTCSGKLTLSAKITTGKGKNKKTKTLTIGSTSFSLKAGESTTVSVKLSGPAKSALAKGTLKAKLKGTGIAPGSVKLSSAKGK
jgi:hypothetical protein